MKPSLFDTVYGDESSKLRRLLRKGVDVNERSPEGTTPLYLAAWNPEKTRLLLKAGADPNAESPEGTPLCFAASWGITDSVDALLEHGAHPDGIEDADCAPITPLVWATGHGHEDVARLLLERGADPNLAPRAGWTPLMAAALRGSISLVEILLEHGADSRVADAHGQTALEVAEEWADRDVEAELRRELESTADEGERITVKRTPQPDGTELVELELRRPNGGGSGRSLQTGHSQIAELLRTR